MRKLSGDFDSTEVLIVGAGPTGLTLANSLRKFAVPFDIIDKNHTVGVASKGLSLNVTSQELFDILGIKDQIIGEGCKIERLHLYINGERSTTIDFNRLHPPRFLVTQPQAITEANLNRCLEDAGITVKWQHRLLGIQKIKHHYQVDIERDDESILRKSYRYIIGCDGKESKVRQYIGSSFMGPDYPMSFVLADFVIVEPLSQTDVSYIYHNDIFFIVIPIGKSVFRVVSVVDKDMLSKEHIGNYLTDLINDYFGRKIIVNSPLWTSSARIYLRQADTLYRDRVFICGDSAHLVSPIGGTGMNMGIQDAFNLAYKIAYVYHGFSDERIFETFNEERLFAIKDTCIRADSMTQLIFDQEFRKNNFPPFLPLLRNRPFIHKIFPEVMSGLGLRYTNANHNEPSGLVGSFFPFRAAINRANESRECLLSTLLIFHCNTSTNIDDVLTYIKALNLSYLGLFSYALVMQRKLYILNPRLVMVESGIVLDINTSLIVSPESMVLATFNADEMDTLTAFIDTHYLIPEALSQEPVYE